MISNGELTYGSRPPALDLYSPSETPLGSIVLALVTVIISYQLTAIVLDLTLGLKYTGVATASAMQTLLLFHTASPLAAFRALFPRTSVRSRFKDQSSQLDDVHFRIWRPFPVVRLLFLLAVAPLVNIASIVALLEDSRTMSVAEAQFRGIMLGVNRDLSVLADQAFEKVTNNTWRAKVQTIDTDRLLVDFIIERIEQDIAAGTDGSANLEVGFPRGAEVFLRVKTPVGGMASRTLSWAVFSEGEGADTHYYIRNGMTNETAAILADAGIRMLAEWCGTDPEESRQVTNPSAPTWLSVQTGRTLPCQREFGDEIDAVKSLTSELSQKVTFIGSDGLNIAVRDRLVSGDIDGVYDGFFRRADDFLFLRRRRKYVSFLGLAVILGVSLLARLIVWCVAHNDVAQGNELMIRKLLGLSFSDSMLSCDQITIRYGVYGDEVEVVHEGVHGPNSDEEPHR